MTLFWKHHRGDYMYTYPVIVNENDLNTPLAYLNNIEIDDCTIHKIINGEDTFSFTAIIEELKSEFLYDESNLILVDDDLFRPLTLEETHHENGLLTISVDCEHISYDLLNKIMPDFSYSNTDIVTVINNDLSGTNFILAGTDVTLKTDIVYTEECNARQILIAIANNWKAELKFNKYNIYAYQQIGENRGVSFRFGKNLKSIKRKVDRSQHDENGNPLVSYEVDVVNLALLGGDYEQLETFDLGDTIKIVDDALGIETMQRIIELERNPLTGKNTSITLGDLDVDLRQTVTGIKETADNVQQVVSNSAPDWNRILNITNNLGQVLADKIAGTLGLMSTQIANSNTTMSITDNGIYFQNQPTTENSTFACLLNSTGILFANSKDTDGNWVWQTAISAEGVVATEVDAAALNGLNIQGVTITGGTINGGTINGITMEGSTIYAGDRQNGNYIQISNTGSIYGYCDNNPIFLFETGNQEGRLILYDSNDQYNTIELYSQNQLPWGSYETLGSALISGNNTLFIGGPNCQDLYISLRNTQCMSVDDSGDVTIYGNLRVKGSVTEG